MRWVRPIFVIASNSSTFTWRASRRYLRLGTRWCTTCSAVAMLIAPGNVSLEDCDMLTWSLGWMGFLEPISPPVISIPRLEMTSFTFMLVWVPEPVCQTTSGKWSSRVPSMTSCAAALIVLDRLASSLPSASFTSAEAYFTMPNPRMSGRGMRSVPILKFSSERCV